MPKNRLSPPESPSVSASASPTVPSSLPSLMPLSPSSVADELKASTLVALRQALASCEAGDWKKVMAACENALVSCKSVIADQLPVQDLFDTAETLKQQGKISEAVRAYLKILQQQPRTYRAYTRLRYNLMRYDIAEGDPVFQEIVDVCQAIVDRVPQLKAARVTMGYGLTKLGKTQAATECYRQASALMMQRRLAASNTGNASSEGGSRPLDFMVIGAEKSGTTSLFQYLYQHPEILSPIEKEIDFFDVEYKYGLDWYLAHFPVSPAQQESQPGAEVSPYIVGETSANYLYDNLSPARVFEHFPTIQLVALLRHPVDRTVSRYNMMVRNGNETRSLEEAITQELQQIEQATTPEGIPWPVLNRCRHVGNSLYYYHLQRWLSYFPREQLLVLPSELLFAQPEQTLSDLCRVLKIGPPPAQAYAKHNAGDYSAVSPALRQRLSAFYQPHVSKLESLLSQSFGWELSA